MSPKEDRLIFTNLVFSKNVQKISSLSSLDANIAQRIVKLAVENIERKPIKKTDYEQLKHGSSLAGPEFDSVFSRLLAILKIAFKYRSRLTPITLKEQLNDSFQMSNNFCDVVVSAVFRAKSSVTNDITICAPHFSICDSLKWRIDVLISNNCVSKIMEPVIVFEMTLSPNRKITFECKLSKFNQLRFAVASILKVINQLEEKTILKSF